MVAHLTGGQGVAGSNPVSPTVGQGRVSGCYPSSAALFRVCASVLSPIKRLGAGDHLGTDGFPNARSARSQPPRSTPGPGGDIAAWWSASRAPRSCAARAPAPRHRPSTSVIPPWYARSPDIRLQAVARAARPDYPAWLTHVKAAAACTRPIRLAGTARELAHAYPSCSCRRSPSLVRTSTPDGEARSTSMPALSKKA